MPKILQSYAWWSVAEKGAAAPAFLAETAKIGYSGVEMLPRELWQAARDAGLQLPTIVGHRSLERGCNHRESAREIEAEVRANLELAVEWNIPMLICFSGCKNGISDEDGLRNCADLLSSLAPLAEQAGVTLIMELLNSKRDHPDYQADHTAWGVELCRRVGSPALRLLYDIYHMQVMEGDIIHTIQSHHPWIAHYHTAGCPGRGFLGENQELHYPAIYRSIAATGYSGWIGHEFLPGENKLSELERVAFQCEQCFANGSSLG